jgi:outer membrane protein assembly factor BamB
VALLVAGVLVTAVVGTVAFAVLRGPARDRAAAGDRQRATAGADGQTIAVTPRWATAPGPASVRAVAVADGVVVSSAGRDVTALDPARGAQLWTSRAPAKVTDLAVLGDLLLVRTDVGVTGYDVTTGKVRWQLADVSIAALVVGRSKIYAARTDAAGITVSAIDPADGGITTLATVTDGTQLAEGAPIALAFDRSARRKGGQLLYMLTDAALHAFDPEAGTQRWRALVDAEGVQDEPHLRRRPWVRSLNAAGGAAFVTDRKGRVCRYAAESGAQVWNGCGRFPTALQRPPVVHVRDGMVIVVGADAIAAYDFTSGKPQWQQTSDEGLQRPAAGGAGTVYVVGADGALRALDHDTGRERWRAEDAGTVTVLLADDDGVYGGGADGVVSRWHDTR